MKTKRERKPKHSHEQEDWIGRLLSHGYYATFAYGFDDAQTILSCYLENRL